MNTLRTFIVNARLESTEDFKEVELHYGMSYQKLLRKLAVTVGIPINKLDPAEWELLAIRADEHRNEYAILYVPRLMIVREVTNLENDEDVILRRTEKVAHVVEE